MRSKRILLNGYQSQVRLNDQDPFTPLAFPDLEISFFELLLPGTVILST